MICQKLRGWEALELKLTNDGLSSQEIEEARASFYRGIELLSRLFLDGYKPANHTRNTH